MTKASAPSATRPGLRHYNRCTATRPDYATPSVPGHPPTYAVCEERILAVVDQWLGTFADPDHIETTVRSILEADEHAEGEPAEVIQARHNRHRLQTELDRLIAAIRAGMDPQLAAPDARSSIARRCRRLDRRMMAAPTNA